MNEDGIVMVCTTLGLGCGKAYPGSSTWGPHISISCPLAPKTHSDPYDGNMSCSVQINDEGPSGARCFSARCGFKGKLLRLIKLSVDIRQKTPELEQLYKYVEQTERQDNAALNAQAAKEIARDGSGSNNLFKTMEQIIAEKKRVIEDRDVLPESAFEKMSGSVPAYAIERGITVQSAKRWNLGYDKDLKYLVFPMRRRDGKLVGLIGRSVLKDPKRRHHNYMGLDKAKHLFGAQLLEPNKAIVIVEGAIDAIRTEQALWPQACVVAALGEGFSRSHVKTIAQMRPPAVYIFTDGDAPGQSMASKIHYALFGQFPLYLMECPWGPIIEANADGTPVRKKVDPADLPDEYIRNLFENAKVIRDEIPWTKPIPTFEK